MDAAPTSSGHDPAAAASACREAGRSAWRGASRAAPDLPVGALQLRCPVWVCDERQRLVFLNAATERLLARPRARCLGRPCHEVVAGRDECGAPWCSASCRVFEGARSGADLEPFTLELPGDTTAKCRVRVIPFVERRDSGRLLLVHVAEEFERPGAARAFLEAVARRRAPGRAADARLPVAGLTRRESEVLRLLARGFQSRQVAASLHVSHVTVRNHIESLLAKLGVHSQLEAVAVYLVQQKRCACIGRRGAARPRVPPIRPRRRELPFGAGPQGAHP